ncbi:MAG: hypothetical protein KC645_07045 [Gemmatimonadetes bacterium]|nr:hypothetical protein [Gemmatimonadota bacterium]
MTTAVLSATAGTGRLAAQDRSAEAWLGSTLGLDAATLERARTGRPATEILEADPRTLAVAGVLRMDRPPRLPVPGRGWTLLGGPTMDGPVLLDDPPSPDAAALLDLPASDVADLEGCRPTDCRLKAPRDALPALARGGGDARRAFRALVQDLARRYRSGEALPAFADKPEPVAPGRAWSALRAQAPELARYGAARTELAYAPAPAGSVAETLVLRRERFGLRPLVTLDHVSELRPGAERPLIVLQRQVYANHYFEASAQVVALEATDAGTWIVLVRRHRLDDVVGPLERRLIEAQVAGYVERQLGALVERLDSGEDRR